MKNLAIVILTLFSFTLFGQTFTTDLSSAQKKKVLIYLEKSNIKVKATKSAELAITTNKAFSTPERAKGLKPLYNDASDNTGIGLDVQNTSNGIVIKRASGQNADYTFEIPYNFDLYVELGFQSGNISLNSFSGEAEIESKISDVKITNMTGPLTINSISGNIEVDYSSDEIKGPSTLNTVSGDIDVTLPKTANLDIELNTLTGEVYVSDPKKFTANDKKNEGLYHIGGQNQQTKYNGGGEELNLITVSGNIYFREK